MLILDGIFQVENDQISIPYYHRGHLSLKSNTAVTLAVIPLRNSADSPKLTEMIVSPIDFRSWPSLWRIEATFLERPGVVNKLLTIVADEGLNVLNEESSSVENRDLHTVELIVDTQRTPGQQDETKEFERMKALERRIIALCIEDLKLQRSNPRLRVKQMKGLHNAWKKFTVPISDPQLPRPFRETSSVLNGVIRLPSEVKNLIAGRNPPRCIIVSDTKERLLRVFFLRDQDGFTYVRIAHFDSRGALAAITRELARAFDIVNSLTRIQRHGAQNDLELLLYSSQFPLHSDEMTRRAIIEDLLSDSALASLSLQVSYPNSVASAEPRGSAPKAGKEKIEFKEQRQVARINESFRNLSTAAVLKSRIEDYDHRVEKEPNFEKRDPLQKRLHKLRELLRSEGEQDSQFRIFVSYDFSRNDLFNHVAANLKRAKCKVITGKDPDDEGSTAFRDVILSRIQSCDGFIGIWTKKEDGSSSPWFLWELGAAQAHKQSFRLLIQEGFEFKAGQNINPEKQHHNFKDSEFNAKSRNAVDKLVEELSRKYGRSRETLL